MDPLVICPCSEHIWRHADSGWSIDGHSGRGLHGTEFGGPGGSPVAVPRHGVCRAATPGAAGETTAAA